MSSFAITPRRWTMWQCGDGSGGDGTIISDASICISFFFKFYNVPILFAHFHFRYYLGAHRISLSLCTWIYVHIFFNLISPHFCHASLSMCFGTVFFNFFFFPLFCLCIVNLIMIFYTFAYCIHSHQFKPISDYCTGHRCLSQ